MIEFEKTLNRDFPLPMVEAWNHTYSRAMPRVFSNRFEVPEPISLYRNGSVESWRPIKVFHQTLPSRISQWLDQSPENMNRFLKEFKYFKKYSIDIKKLKKNNAPTANVALKIIKQACQLWEAGCVGLVLVQWCPHWNDEAVRSGHKPFFSDDLIETAISMRRYDTLSSDSADVIYANLYKIAIIKSWPKELMKFFLFEELQKAVGSNKPDLNKISQRQKGYLYYRSELLLKGQWQKFLRRNKYKLKGRFLKKQTEKIKGSVANRGLVTGRVRVIVNRSQLVNFVRGDILVAAMTSPWHLPAIKLAAAFVTDEGGITCHAAIVSRELKKPCIIGTKIATKVLKDGDLVEVDANKGIVRKIK